MAGVGDVPAFDQRGSPFTRVFDGDGAGGARIDIGAVEDQPIPLAGDYNSNGSVDAADFVVWRKTLNSSVDLRADGDGDGVIDQDDYAVWRANFGKVAAAASALFDHHIEDNDSGANSSTRCVQNPISREPGTTAWRGRARRLAAAICLKSFDRNEELLAWWINRADTS
jgi:hypothetical protein